jgi:hypothetical protein
MTSRTRKRKSSADSRAEASLRIGRIKIRRGTEDVDSAVQNRIKNDSFFALPGEEFTKRKRFVDRHGNVYAPPRSGDPIYERYRTTGRIEDALEAPGVPPASQTLKSRRATGRYRGTALLYARKKRGRKLVSAPRGEIEILDTETLELYTGRISRSIFQRDSKSGHVVVQHLTSFGRVTDPRGFNVRE